MLLSKQRLEAFSDGIIAIIITIMVLSVPLPTETNVQSILSFLGTIFMYFLSFIVVGAFWSQHHIIFNHIDKINGKIISLNLIFLFFLSLIPIMTKWVMENMQSTIPAVGYVLTYLLVQFCYVMIFSTVLSNSENEHVIKMRQKRADLMNEKSFNKASKREAWILFIFWFVVVLIIISAMFINNLLSYVLLGLPVLSSVINLLLQDKRYNHNYENSIKNSNRVD